ncbi:MAG: hypothetical protein MUF21_06260 [Gemmatimonadaceae bacterium]|jgi:hypothetical protein|nr:hypothetical protein [Gemmatimonadaceae bacterium]
MRVRSLLPALAALVAAACSTDEVAAPPTPLAAGTMTVDAATGWVYVRLADSARVVPTPSARESGAWDIAFFATNVTLNGGQAGPGGVTGACLCQNSAQAPTAAQWLAMTPASERADFDSVTRVPATASFTSDRLTPSLAGWFTGNGASAVAAPDSLAFVRLSDSSGVAKLRVTRLDGATATSPGRVTIEYATAAFADAAFGATRTATLDATAGAVAFDLQTGQPTTSPTDWDVRVEGFAILVNGGVSGPGRGAAARVRGTTFAAATPTATAANAYRVDAFAGIFGTARFFNYNLGGDNRIAPTYDVYFIRRGSTTWKLQIIDYYSPTGTPRVITFRYAPVAG